MTEPGAATGTNRGGAFKAFAPASANMDHLPLFKLGCERVAQQWEKARKTKENDLEMSLEFASLSSVLIGDFVASNDGSGVTAICDASEWATRTFIGVDRAALDLIVDSSLGGDGSSPAAPAKRPATLIEKKLGSLAIETLMKAIEAAFLPIFSPRMVIEKLVDRPRLHDAGPRNDRLLVALYRLRCSSGEGQLRIAMSYAGIAAHRQKFARSKIEDARPVDHQWAEHIQTALAQSEVQLTAVLEEGSLSLDEIADFAVGKIIPLRSTVSSVVTMTCGGEAMLKGRLGQMGGALTLRIVGVNDPEHDGAWRSQSDTAMQTMASGNRLGPS